MEIKEIDLAKKDVFAEYNVVLGWKNRGRKMSFMSSFGFPMNNSGEMTENQPLLKDSPKGGLKIMPLILANGMLVNMATFGLMPSMGLFLTEQFHVELTTSSNIMFFWVAAFNVIPVIGAAIADSYLGRFQMIGLGSILALLGTILLWLTTMVAGLSPPPCINTTNNYCGNSTVPQLLLLSISLTIVAIGSGSVRSSILAFGADQLSIKEDRGGIMAKFYGWFYATTMVSIIFGFTFLVYIQEKLGWKIGFGVSVVLMIVATPCFLAGSSYYVKTEVKPNLLTELIQVVVVSFKKRKIRTTPGGNDDKDGVVNVVYHHGSVGGTSDLVSKMLFPSENFRFLNKACMIEDEEEELNREDGTAKDPWSLCRVEQVEDLKALLKVIPIWSAGVIAFITMSQGSFTVLQANSTNRKIFSNFEIPAGSFSTFSLICLALWVPFYNHVVLPIASRINGKPTYFSIKQRIGAGIFVSFLSMVVTALVEGIRRKSGTRISALWLLPQYCLLGIMEALVAIGQSEFYISEFPHGMWSIAASLCSVEISMANVLSSFLMNTMDDLTKRVGKHESWVSSDLDKAHFDYYFWVVSGLCLLNFFYYLFCSWSYGPSKDEQQYQKAMMGKGDDDLLA